MTPYFIILSPIILMAMKAPMRRLYPFLWVLAFITIWIFVGLRHHVGMDWNNYLFMIQRANVGGVLKSFEVAEPGYALILWLSGQAGWGIYGAYSIGTAIFLAGLFRYARTTPAPWIALLVAMPYLVIVISMSAARQTVAIGVLLWLVAEWTYIGVVKRVALILLATSFHMSAVGFLIFIFMDLKIRPRIRIFGTFLAAAAILYLLKVSDESGYYQTTYGIVNGKEIIASGGALMHTMLNAGPALAVLFIGKKSQNFLMPNQLHMQMAIISIILVPLSLWSSTTASRLTIYFFPVSMWFFATLPWLFSDASRRTAIKMGISVIFLLVTIIWLTMGNNAKAYQSYKNVLFINPSERVLCCK